ncbi:MAG: lycopene cyclase family protein [Rubripirellula sp.]
MRQSLRPPDPRCLLLVRPHGCNGGWFHAATGYSFPLAVAFAQAIASGSLELARDRVDALSEKHRLRSRYSRFLNRLLFRLVARQHRHRIFRRFYRVLSDASIERFYSYQFTAGDALRIVIGIPPTLIGLRPHRFVRSFFPGDQS